MVEREQVLQDLGEAGVLDVMKWAAKWANDTAWSDYDPDKGHNRTVLGVLAHSILMDRLDRATRCKKYAVDSPDDDADNLDVLFAKLLPVERESMPIAPDGVARADYRGSPAWRF